MKTRFLIIIAVCMLGFFINAFAYHGEQERLEMSQMTGLFDSDQNFVMYPLIDTEYRLQIVLREEAEYGNSIVDVGYGFQLLERFPSRMSSEYGSYFMGFEKTSATLASRDSKQIHTNQYNFPILVNFTVNFEKPGVHSYSFFENKIDPNYSSGSHGGGYHIVSHYSKAIAENGECKNPELGPIVKHDFSTLVCVTSDTRHELITRGWAPLP